MMDLKLSDIEYTVLNLMAKDKGTNDISKILNKNKRTIEAVRNRLRGYANCNTSTGLMIWGVEQGYIELKKKV